MGESFDRVAIALSPGGKEYIVLETQVMVDYGQGQGPRGGVVTVEDGLIAVHGPGEAQLSGGFEEQGGTFSPRLTILDDQGQRAVEIAAYPDPGPIPLTRIRLEGKSATLRMGDSAGNDHALLDGAKADLWLGGKAAAGDVVLFRSGESDNRNTAKATIRFDAQASSLRMRDSSGNDHALLDGANANLWLGGEAADGDIVLFRSGESDNRNTAKASIHLNAQAGDIILGNADCAEDFEVAELDEAQPGTVMVIDDEGRLRQSRIAYDKRVAGVVSGACDSRPGIVLDRHVGHGSRRPLALIGKTYCKADAGYSQISVGDLLTTSSTPGHAMKATDQHHAFGAVIGKALQPLCDGQAMIPILINLQ